MSSMNSHAQSSVHYLRIAQIEIDPAQLEPYKAALKEGMAAAVKTEPGVLSLRAVYDKDRPAHITVFEVYADEKAYQLHIQTPHFKKYKTTVEKMVRSLVLTDVLPIALEDKRN